MARNKQSVSIVDVAKAAGVSVSTVSRVINNKDDVSYATHQHVSQVIEELGYTSSLAAKGMRSRQTGVIGLIMPDVDDPFSIEVMRGVNEAIIELDYDLLIYTNGYIRRNNSASWEKRYVSLLNSGITDGVIVVTPMSDHFESSSAVVAIDPNRSDPAGPAIISTNRLGAYDAIQHLLDLGHHRIGHIEGRSDLQSAILRREGYDQALKDAGLDIDLSLIAQGDFTTERGIECARHLLSLDQPPTAIFAANDQTAKGVFFVAEELGLNIPHDLSVVGFDNVPEAAYLNLTTVDQSIRQMGHIGTRMLFDLMQGKQLRKKVHKVATKLIPRGSSHAIGTL